MNKTKHEKTPQVLFGPFFAFARVTLFWLHSFWGRRMCPKQTPCLLGVTQFWPSFPASRCGRPPARSSWKVCRRSRDPRLKGPRVPRQNHPNRCPLVFVLVCVCVFVFLLFHVVPSLGTHKGPETRSASACDCVPVCVCVSCFPPFTHAACEARAFGRRAPSPAGLWALDARAAN